LDVRAKVDDRARTAVGHFYNISQESVGLEQRQKVKDKQRADPEDLKISNPDEQFFDATQTTAISQYALYYSIHRNKCEVSSI
jgi:hypothetical protein